jgi:phosphonate transport system substrate-binding protein
VREGAESSSKFRGQIICRADNPAIATLADCRGKRWIAVDPNSAGGYLYALGLFHSQGLRPGDFAEIAFAPGPGGKQEKVVLAVWAGKYDIGSIREGTLQVVGEKIDLREIRVLAATPWYPGWVYAARAGLDPEVADAVAKALFKLSAADKEQRRILDAARIMGFVPAQDRDYDPIRNLATQIGIHLD